LDKLLNDALTTKQKLDKIESDQSLIADQMSQIDNDQKEMKAFINKMDVECAKVTDMNTLVDDLQNTINDIVNSTPRDYNTLKTKLDNMNSEIQNLKMSSSIIVDANVDQTQMRNIPKIQFVKARKQ
jgi:chromosome segregation ATPase